MMLFGALVVFGIGSFVSFRLGYSYGIWDGAKYIVSSMKVIMTPEEMTAFDKKAQDYLNKYDPKNKQLP